MISSRGVVISVPYFGYSLVGSNGEETFVKDSSGREEVNEEVSDDFVTIIYFWFDKEKIVSNEIIVDSFAI